MTGYLLKRLGTSLLMLLSASLLIFVVLRALPGDPVTTLLGPGNRGVGSAEIDAFKEQLGLNKPFMVQYVIWIFNFFQGDFGRSFFSDEKVSSMIAGNLVPTLELTAASMTLAVIGALIFATIGAIRPRSMIDRLVTLIASLGMAIPTFVMAIFLLLVFGIWWRILPTRGYISFSEDPVENLKLLLLPTLTLSFAAMAPILRMLRASLSEASSSPWTRTAEGKGLLWPRIVMKHILPNALIPTLTVIGITFGRLLGGVVLIEYIFSWPGIGTLMVDAIFKRDYAVLQATILFAAVAAIVVNLLVDLAYGFVDPRLSFKNK